MLIKLFILSLSLFIFGCGKNVRMKPNQLESLQTVTQDDLKKYEKAGIINTATISIVTSGKSYKISKYSNHKSMTFINTLPGASQIPIIWRGGIDIKDEILLEDIRRQ